MQEPWHRLFEIHRNWDYGSPISRELYLDDLKEIKPPRQVVSIVKLEGPANVVIDREALFKKYGAIWFSSSFGYMLACALEETPTDIGIWGVEMESREEYVVQFAGVRHFIDLAKFMGIKVYVPERSTLLREPGAYADRFETTLAFTLEEKARFLQKGIRQTEDSIINWRDLISREEERLALADKLDWTPLQISNFKDEIRDDKHTLRRLEAALNRAKGELYATQHYKRLFVWNVLPPEFGKEEDTDVEDCGPI